MPKVIINRDHSYPNGTEGTLIIVGQTHEKIYTLEKEWQGNANNISCIPKGKYICVPHGWEANSSFHQKQCWEIIHVPNRTGILIHTGNSTADVEGCVLVGLEREDKNGIPLVLKSRDAIAILRELIGNNEFELTLQGV